MKNNFSKKFIASLMLTTFSLSNIMLTAAAMENPPVLRGEASSSEFSLKLKGDVNYIKSRTPVSISLRDSDVKQVLRMFADKAGMNIIFHNSVDGTVTLDLVDVPLNEAFDMIMNISDLNYVVDNGTIVVAKAGSSGFNMAKQDMTLIPVKYVSASAIADFLNKNIYAMHKPGLSDGDIVTTNPVTNELIIFGSTNDVAIAKKVIEKFDVKPKITTFKVNHTTPSEMANMICQMLLPATGGGKSTGGAAGIATGFAAGGSLDIANTGSSSGNSSSGLSLNGGEIACTLDGKTGGSVSSLGLQNMSIAFYPQQGTISILGGSDKQLEMIKEFINDTDKKQPQAYLEVAIVELNESGSKSLQNNWTFLSNTFSATFNGGTTSTDPLHPIFLKGNKYEVWDTSSEQPQLINTLNKFNGPVNVALAINYLIRNSKGRVVSNPKILITNGETSKIDITQDYIESTENEQTAYTGGTLVSRSYNIGSDAGIQVEITPFISPDGYVTLNIKPEYATILRQETDTDASGVDYIAATLLSRRNLDLKNVRIKDGETLVIAGLINEEEQKVVGKVPVLGDIPGIGALFRSTNTTKTKNEMVIMITPKIVTDTEDAVENTDTL